MQMYEEGIYQPLTTEEAVSTTKEMYRILSEAGITILRVGLKSTDLITEGEAVCGHTFHPAFRQLIEGELAKESLETQLLQLLENAEKDQVLAGEFAFRSNGHSFSNMIGNAKRNKLYFAEKYPGIKIRWKTDPALRRAYTVLKYNYYQNYRRGNMKAVITVIGKDMVGILAKVSTACANQM